MARLHVLGDWHGFGEEKTARRLADELPQDWDVVAGRQIPDALGTVDLDLVVVGANSLFVCEEKAWGKRIHVGEVTWYVDGDRRHNPANQVAHASRVLAGRLRTKVDGWKQGLAALPRGRRPVSGHVVLSHDNLTLVGAAELGEDVVLRLAETSKRLEELDAEFPAALGPLRPRLMSYLLGLDKRPEAGPPERIMQYRVLGRPTVQGNAKVYPARNPAGDPVLLYCVPVSGSPDTGGAARRLATREHDALEALAARERTWRVQGWFDWEDYLVTPIVVAMDGTSLGKLAHDTSEAVAPDVAVAVVHDAFRALADVHGEDITHRALQLRSIEVTPPPGNRVRLRDLSRAHLPSTETIAPSLESDHPSSAFQPPGTTPEFFQPGDDVYALALCLVQWLHGDAADEPDHDLARTRAAAYPGVGTVLARCLAPKITDRPTAAEAADLTDPSPPAPPPPPPDAERMEPNALLAGRYRLLEKLGEGAWAQTWLAWDETLEVHRSLKHLHPHKSNFDDVRNEYLHADLLHSPYCARPYDVLAHPEPGVLVQTYVPGQSLQSAADSGRLVEQEHLRRVAVDVLRGLADAHRELLFHRDVSPNNIIVRDDGSAALIDFGLAQRASDAKSAVGSPPFTAPEVITRRDWTPAADIYSAAVSVLRAVLGRYPYAGLSLEERRTLVPPSAAQRQRFGGALLDALFRAAAYDPADRPQDAAIFADQLQRARDVPVRPAGLPRTNPTVDALRGLYRGSSLGNAGNRGMDDVFAHDTYVRTRLDDELLPAVLAGELDVVVLSGNPGDGKTSFLVQVGQALDDAGAESVHADAAGWRKRLGGRTYAAVYDASESHEGLSADDLMRSALDPAPGDDPDRRTVLLAANDGRVAQFFFADYADRYPQTVAALERQGSGEAPAAARIVLVDLKRRALALPPSAPGTGIAVGILDSLTEHGRWAECADCVAHDVCPIRRNAELLRSDGARAAVSELLLTSHLRRRRRATVRDVRSAFGWLITGDLSCAAVHAEHERGQDPGSGPLRRTPDLTFARSAADYLIDEWSELDPAGLAAPSVGRAARADRNLIPDLSAVEQDVMGRLKRSLFFGAWSAPASAQREARAYRYLPEYLAALDDPEPARARILLGVSRILAYPGYDDESHLALRDRVFDDPAVRAIVVVKELAADQFRLEPAAAPSPFVESFTDQLVLRHPESNARLRVTIDLAELLFRAADGEIVGDIASAALRQEIAGFGNRLRLQPARSVRIVDGSGRAVRASVIDGGRIALGDR